jgi:hypothetical protein
MSEVKMGRYAKSGAGTGGSNTEGIMVISTVLRVQRVVPHAIASCRECD